MNETMENDFDRIAAEMDKVMQVFAGNAHEPNDGSDSITITKDGFISGVIRLQRLRNWVAGFAETHRD